MNLLSDQFLVSWPRSIVQGVILAGSTFFGSLLVSPDTGHALVVAGVAFFGSLGARGLGEGLFDTRRAALVAQPPPATVPPLPAPPWYTPPAEPVAPRSSGVVPPA